jgi:hypothetical protein
MSAADPRDPELERVYRELDAVEPPSDIDAAVSARARAAVGTMRSDAGASASAPAEQHPASRTSAASASVRDLSRTRGATPHSMDGDDEPPSELWPMRDPHGPLLRWRVPIAVAATLVVAGSLVFLMQADDRTDGVLTPREPPSAAASRATKPPLGAKPEGVAEAERNRAERAAQPPQASPAPRSAERPAGGPPSMAATPAPSPPPAPAQARERAGDRSGSSEGTNAGNAARPPFVVEIDGPRTQTLSDDALSSEARTRAPPPAAAADEASARAAVPDAAPTREASGSPTATGNVAGAAPRAAQEQAPAVARDTPLELVERIRALRRAGREDEARRLLGELTQRYPAFELPQDLRDLR